LTPISSEKLHALSLIALEFHMHTLLSINKVSAKVSLSISQIRRLLGANQFPRPITISPGRKGWLEKDVDKWIQNLIEESKND
jgi:predicted DNA-binding transcriptional regulator AlpA